MRCSITLSGPPPVTSVPSCCLAHSWGPHRGAWEWVSAWKIFWKMSCDNPILEAGCPPGGGGGFGVLKRSLVPHFLRMPPLIQPPLIETTPTYSAREDGPLSGKVVFIVRAVYYSFLGFQFPVFFPALFAVQSFTCLCAYFFTPPGCVLFVKPGPGERG